MQRSKIRLRDFQRVIGLVQGPYWPFTLIAETTLCSTGGNRYNIWGGGGFLVGRSVGINSVRIVTSRGGFWDGSFTTVEVVHVFSPQGGSRDESLTPVSLLYSEILIGGIFVSSPIDSLIVYTEPPLGGQILGSTGLVHYLSAMGGSLGGSTTEAQVSHLVSGEAGYVYGGYGSQSFIMQWILPITPGPSKRENFSFGEVTTKLPSVKSVVVYKK